MLTLEIVGSQAAKLGVATRKEFGPTGGTIGRSADNDWVIPDSYISGRHAQIHFRNGRFFIVDCSANGTSLKSRANRLTKGQWYPLVDQDRLFLDSIEVRIHAPSTEQQTNAVSAEEVFNKTIVETPFGSALSHNDMANNDVTNDDAAQAGLAQPRTTPLAMPTDAVLQALFNDDDIAAVPTHLLNAETIIEPRPIIPQPPDSLSIDASTDAGTDDHLIARTVAMKLDDADDAEASEEWPPTQVLHRQGHAISIDSSPLDLSLEIAGDSTEAVSSSASAPSIPPPANIQRSGEASRSRTEKPEATKPEAALSVMDTIRFNTLLEGAGIPSSAITPELSDTFGKILRATIGGLIDLLRERDAMKDSFRLSVTKFKPAENNPLRFSANVEDALYNLLVKRNSAYLAPAEAISSSFADARCHQAAMLVAMRSAFAGMMQFFDPDKLAAAMDDKPKQRRFFSKGGDDQWTQYSELYRQLAEQPDHGFEQLFGERFARAYQQEMDRLREQIPGSHS